MFVEVIVWILIFLKDNNRFNVRVSAIIYNSEKNKVLLFKVVISKLLSIVFVIKKFVRVKWITSKKNNVNLFYTKEELLELDIINYKLNLENIFIVRRKEL